MENKKYHVIASFNMIINYLSASAGNDGQRTANSDFPLFSFFPFFPHACVLCDLMPGITSATCTHRKKKEKWKKRKKPCIKDKV